MARNSLPTRRDALQAGGRIFLCHSTIAGLFGACKNKIESASPKNSSQKQAPCVPKKSPTQLAELVAGQGESPKSPKNTLSSLFFGLTESDPQLGGSKNDASNSKAFVFEAPLPNVFQVIVRLEESATPWPLGTIIDLHIKAFANANSEEDPVATRSIRANFEGDADLDRFIRGVLVSLLTFDEPVGRIEVSLTGLPASASLKSVEVFAEKPVLVSGLGLNEQSTGTYLPANFSRQPRGFQIIPRSAWTTREPRSPPSHSRWQKIVVHHSAMHIEPSSQAESHLRVYQASHMDAEEWNDIGYNYLVAPDGRVFEGRKGGKNTMGAHTADFNDVCVAINLIGNYETTYKAQKLNRPTEAQLDSLARLTAWLCKECDIDPNLETPLRGIRAGTLVPGLTCHLFLGKNGVQSGNGTLCPGDLVIAALPTVREKAGLYLKEYALDSASLGGPTQTGDTPSADSTEPKSSTPVACAP